MYTTKMEMMQVRLPEGYLARPACMDDAGAVTEMCNAWSSYTLGLEKFTSKECASEWQTPGFNLETDSRLVLRPDGQAVGYYDVWDAEPHVTIGFWGHVRLEYVERGLDAYLLEWAEERARQSIPKAPRGARVSMWTHALHIDEAAHKPLTLAGFDLIRHSLRMVVEMNGHPPAAKWPDGIDVRTLREGLDERAVFQAIRESFRDHFGYIERPFEVDFERFLHLHRSQVGYDPSLWFLAVAGDEIAGVSLCRSKIHDDPEMGWVSTLGVCRPWRRRGVGLALLHHSFGELYRRGKRKVGLGVDAQSLTGATRLYLRAGMHPDPTRQFDLYEKELRPGIELTRQMIE
jgi:GNAT superfamily N-acetyltransferase